ncbi:Stage II sporulation protein E (SpoIIE) [Promicromonospora umidemergens]|uniref:PPM-type phosphatase domain-containing protein n=1 Tax=Promicromonospora umidemergens TaxID=629679 RepID=A0ABP8XC84_9MICO|nr:SpoIIE family protein phosphatase [Promicromonospora umidemergens]MCP2281547.1 Stage II sporulation protein E (SpoIIE) [Promicromonospora umidemergens]
MTPPGRARSWDSAPVALLRLDGAGAILDANDTFRSWFDDAGARDLRGTRLSALLSVGGRIYWETHLAPLLRMQGRVEEIAVELRAGGTRRPVLLSAELHGDGDDDDIVINVALFDARERSRFERELMAAHAEAERSAASVRTLLVTTTALARAAGVEGVCEALVHAAVGEFRAESASVWLVDGSGTLTLRARLGDDASVEKPSAALLEATRDAASITDGSGESAAAAAEVVIAPDGQVVVPLHGADTFHGILVLAPRAHAGDDALDRGALAATGQQGGVALDRAVLHEQSVSVAYELQRAMLTEHLPQPERARLSTDYRPAERSLEVGGDWYDAFWVDDVTLALAVGDVVGHGLDSATAMGQLRTVVRSCAESGVGPVEVLARVDRFVQRRGVGFGSTLVYAELDVTTGRLVFACAGHPPPLVTRPDGDAEFLWQGRRRPLGVITATDAPVLPPAAVMADRSGRHSTHLSGPEAGPGVLELRRGDVLWLYTDGMVERRDRSLPTGLEAFARAAAGSPGAAVASELVPSLLGGELNEYDDACVLRLEWDALDTS